MTTTQKSVLWLRKQGAIAAGVEHWNGFAKRRQDLWGADVIAVWPAGTVELVQATDHRHVRERQRNLVELKVARELRDRGIRYSVHGWQKGARDPKRLSV